MNEWTLAAEGVYALTREALQTVYAALNQGQQQKLLKDQQVKALFDRYDIGYDG